MRSAFGTVVSILLLSASVTAQSREFSRTVELDPSGALRVVGAIGSIRITSWEQPQVEIRARIERPDQVSDEYATRAIDATSIEVTGDRRAVSVVSNYSKVPVLHLRRGSYGRRDPPVHYEIRAPRKIVLNVDSDRGPLTVSSFEGVFDIVADRGTLDLRDVGGDLRIDIDRGERSRTPSIVWTSRSLNFGAFFSLHFSTPGPASHSPRSGILADRGRSGTQWTHQAVAPVIAGHTEDLLLGKCPEHLGQVDMSAPALAVHPHWPTAQRPIYEDNGVGGSMLYAAPFLGVVKQKRQIACLPVGV